MYTVISAFAQLHNYFLTHSFTYTAISSITHWPHHFLNNSLANAVIFFLGLEWLQCSMKTHREKNTHNRRHQRSTCNKFILSTESCLPIPLLSTSQRQESTRTTLCTLTPELTAFKRQYLAEDADEHSCVRVFFSLPLSLSSVSASSRVFLSFNNACPSFISPTPACLLSVSLRYFVSWDS